MLGSRFDAVLFDMDGTLLSSIGSVVRSWTRLAQEFGIPAESFGDFHGIPARALLDILMAERPVAERERAFARIVEIEVADVGDIEVLPGAAAALAAVAESGAIVTSSTRRLALARLAASGLSAPEVVVFAEDVTRGKPDPDPYLLAAARLGVAPARCLVVEDSAAGVAAARAAGAATVALTTSEPGAIGADLTVPDLSALRFVVVPGGVVVEDARG